MTNTDRVPRTIAVPNGNDAWLELGNEDGLNL